MKNLNAPHFDDVERQTILALVQQLKALLLPKFMQLLPEERQRYGAVNEQNKLFLSKVAELRESQPDLSSPQVDWLKFQADFDDRKFLGELLMYLKSLTYDVQSTKIAHDHDNFNAARLDYAFTEYSTKSDSIGAIQKFNELKQFLKRSSHTKDESNSEDDESGDDKNFDALG